MPRYLVERTFTNGLGLPVCAEGAAATAEICKKNLEEDVTWLHSYVSADKSTTFCIYDGPNPDAILRVTTRWATSFASASVCRYGWWVKIQTCPSSCATTARRSSSLNRSRNRASNDS